MDFFAITGLLLALAIGWLFLDSLRARDAAVVAARQACESEGFQLLDDTVAIARMALGRNEDGVLGLRRRYVFEYSDTGNNRRQGGVILAGHEVLAVEIASGGRPTLTVLH